MENQSHHSFSISGETDLFERLDSSCPMEYGSRYPIGKNERPYIGGIYQVYRCPIRMCVHTRESG